jgi:hypothetical protein
MNKNSNDNLNKLIEDLKKKIKTIDKQSNNSLYKTKTYRISMPKKYSKKYIGLLFDDSFDDNGSDNISDTENVKSFLRLDNDTNFIINYSIQLKVETFNLNENSFFSLGIKEKNNKNIKIIKGSKQQFINKNIVVNNTIIINNTIIFTSDKDQELCLIAEIGSDVKIISKKSLIKILKV